MFNRNAMSRSKMLLVNSETLRQVMRVHGQFSHISKAVVFGLGSLSSQRSRLQVFFMSEQFIMCKRCL